MIEINLSPGKGTGSSSGNSVDFNEINIKGMILAGIIYIGVSFIVPYFYNARLGSWDAKLDDIRSKLATVKRKVKQVKTLEKEIEVAKQQEKLLYDQLGVVKQITTNKKSPLKMLLYISNNLPENTWIVSFKLDNDKLLLIGRSFSYNLIGKFFDSLENSVFFDGRPELTPQSVETSLEKDGTTRRLEGFTIQAKIKQYEL